MAQQSGSKHDNSVMADTRRDVRSADEPYRDGGTIIEPDTIRKAPLESAPGPQVLTSDTARQAPAGFPVLYVLVISLVAAALVLGLYTIFWTRGL